MDVPCSRRQFLTSAIVCGGALTAGCAALGNSNCTKGKTQTKNKLSSKQVSGSWPRIRADLGNTGWNPNAQSSKKDPIYSWRFSTCSTGITEPIIANNRVLVGTSDGLYALNARTGNVRWRTTERTVPVAPTVADGVVYVSGKKLSAYDLKTGNKNWEFDFQVDSPVRTSPAVTESVVVAGGTDQTPLYGLNAENGEVIWQQKITSPKPSTPAISDETVYLTTKDDQLVALDTQNGDRRWNLFVEENAHSTPTVKGNYAYASSEHGVTGFDIAAKRRKWTTSVTSSQIAVDDKNLYFEVDNHIWVYENESGHLYWNRKIAPTISDTGTFGVYALGGNTIYFGSSKGTIVALDTRTAGKSKSILWSFNTRTTSTLLTKKRGIVGVAAAGSVVYVTTKVGDVYALAIN